ncbi:MAG: hypothetical protein ABI882_08630 [Acidobacteriota bacterium]
MIPEKCGPPNSTRRLMASFSLLMMFAGVAGAQVRVMPGDVKDTRRTDGFFNKLEVEMKVVGEILTEAKGVRVIVARAVDETGKDLMPEKVKENEFKELDTPDTSTIKVEFELKNPARQALAVQEISGTVELFVPKRDPSAMVTIPSLGTAVGRAFVSPALKAAGIEVSIWNKEQYQTRKKTEEERLKKAFEEKKKKAAESGTPDEDLGDALANGLMKIFGGLFGALTEMGENGIAIQVNDPKRQLVGIEFRDASGKTISHQGRTTLGDTERTMIYDFAETLPATTQIRFFLMTPRSIVKVPFKLTGVPLP